MVVDLGSAPVVVVVCSGAVPLVGTYCWSKFDRTGTTGLYVSGCARACVYVRVRVRLYVRVCYVRPAGFYEGYADYAGYAGCEGYAGYAGYEGHEG